jgi:hypothetical protein
MRNPKAVLRRERAIVALLKCRTVAQAATEAAIGERTLSRWLAESGFQQEYREAQRRLLEHAINTLHHHAGDFADVIVLAAKDKSVPMAIRLGAASKGLDVLLKVHEHADLEYKMGEIEQAIERMRMERLGVP